MKKQPFFAFGPKRPLAFCAAFYALGLAAGILWRFAMPAGVFGAALGIGLAIVLWLRGKPWVYGAALALFFISACVSSGLMRVPFAPAGTLRVTGYVEGEAQIRENGSVRAVLRDAVGVDPEGKEIRLGKTYWTYRPREDESLLRLAETLFDGDLVSFDASAYEPTGRVNPYGFDFRLYLKQGGFEAAVSGCGDPEITKEARLTLSGAVFRLRLWLLERMDAIFGEQAAWPQALLLGVRDRLQEDTVQAFRDLGIAHVLAVSGLHVALIAAPIQAILIKCRFSGKIRLLVLFVFLALYAALLQFSSPVVRASILILLSECRQLVRRSSDPLSTVAAAMLAILVFSPLQVMAAGFILTFSAVLGIVLLREPVANLLRFLPWAGLRDALGVTAGASLGVLIPAANLYHSVSLVGIAVSPLVCLLMSALLPVYLMITVTGILYLPAGQLLSQAVHALIGWTIPLTLEAGAQPFVRLAVPAFPLVTACALIAVLFLCTRYCLLDRRRRMLLACGLAVIGIALPLAMRDGRVSYVQFAEGQSDAAVIEDGNATVLIDVGENGSDLAAYLLSKGRRADIVVLTHLHSDHCGGLMDLLADRVEIGQVILAPRAFEQAVDETGAAVMEKIRELQIPLRLMARGDSFRTERANFTVLWPERDRIRAGQDPNIYSMAILCEAEGVRILFTGDLVGSYEKYAAADADVLKVPHHGSASSSTEAFLAAVSPELSVITCRAGQSLPSRAALERLEACGTRILRTDHLGAVRISLDQGRYEVTPYLQHME